MVKKQIVVESEESDYESQSEEVVIEKPKIAKSKAEKPKRVQTEKQKEAFAKARAGQEPYY